MVVHGSAQIQICRANPAHRINNMHVGVYACVLCATSCMCAC